MKIGLSRKNAWERLPPSAKNLAGAILQFIPIKYLLGKRYREMYNFVEEAQWWNEDQIEDFVISELRRICTIAYVHCPFYKKLFMSAGFEPAQMKSLDDFRRIPMIDKKTIKDNSINMCSVSLTSKSVDYTSTGGTTGEPLHFYIGTDRSQKEFAYLVSSWGRAGYQLGTPLAVFRGQVIRIERQGMPYEYDPVLRRHFYSSFHMSEGNIKRYIEHLRQIGDCFLHVYPSTATLLAHYMQNWGVESLPNVRGIIAESEIVYPEQRELIEKTFGCRLFSCYGMTEKVVAAAGCEHSTDYHVWGTYGHFELVDDQGRPVTSPGMRGEIVGTSFMNEVMPFIRYRTGDYAVYVDKHCDRCGRQGPVIREIRGHRIQEMLVAGDGSQIPWTALNMHDDTFTNVFRFQFFQNVPGLATLRIVPVDSFNSEDEYRIKKNLKRKLDERIAFEIEIVDSIPVSGTGKAIYVDQQIQSERGYN